MHYQQAAGRTRWSTAHSRTCSRVVCSRRDCRDGAHGAGKGPPRKLKSEHSHQTASRPGVSPTPIWYYRGAQNKRRADVRGYAKKRRGALAARSTRDLSHPRSQDPAASACPPMPAEKGDNQPKKNSTYPRLHSRPPLQPRMRESSVLTSKSAPKRKHTRPCALPREGEHFCPCVLCVCAFPARTFTKGNLI